MLSKKDLDAMNELMRKERLHTGIAIGAETFGAVSTPGLSEEFKTMIDKEGAD